MVRDDIPQPHRTVQACHAALSAAHAFGGNPNPHLVVCTAPDEPALDALFNRLKGQGVPCCAYYEPDFEGNQLTAVATAPLRGEGRRPLRRQPLLR